MAQGYVDVPHASYEEWKQHTLNGEYDLDGHYGCQCWDYASLFWRNIGFPAGYPQTGNGYAYGCWTLRRNVNAGNEFELIELLSLVKKGDVVVLDQGRFTGDTTGHIAFADEDYTGGAFLNLLGQNQENASATTGYKVTVTRMNITKFLGAFRYKGWAHPPEPTPESKKKNKYPWAVFGNKYRNSYILN
jgi:hypothetical protein